MVQKRKILIAGFSVAAIATLAYIVVFSLQTPSIDQSTARSKPKPIRHDSSAEGLAESDFDSDEVDGALLKVAVEDEAVDKEALVRFSDDASYRAFLSSLSSKGLLLLGNSDKLRTARIGFSKLSQLSDIDGADISPNFPVFIPSPPDVSAQVGAVGFAGTALESIGIFEDNSQWGAGITVAVIDSGVNQHIALQDGVKRLELTELTDDTSQLGHGTAVASIISGNHPLTLGVAPASEILSIRITDDQGSSNSFNLAEGIIAAVDGGAQIINISMGSEGNSSIVADAVSYAQSLGAVIVASSGNEGLNTPAYPAAYDGVISVGAIEATGEHLDFSNTGENLSISAPGYQVNAAWGEDLLTAFSGTSASAPFVSGAIAAVMSENPGYTAQQATDLVLSLSNEAGLPGADSEYGIGTLDLGRALENGTSGVYDIAITGQLLGTNSAGSTEVTIVIQNQGTETLFNSPVSIQTPNGTTDISINSLTPSQVYTTTLSLPTSVSTQDFSIFGSASTGSTQDVDPRNNTKQSNFSPSAE